MAAVLLFCSGHRGAKCRIALTKCRTPVRLPAILTTLTSFPCSEVNFVDELLEEDRLGD
jgi:hypothetical protein